MSQPKQSKMLICKWRFESSFKNCNRGSTSHCSTTYRDHGTANSNCSEDLIDLGALAQQISYVGGS